MDLLEGAVDRGRYRGLELPLAWAADGHLLVAPRQHRVGRFFAAPAVPLGKAALALLLGALRSFLGGGRFQGSSPVTECVRR